MTGANLNTKSPLTEYSFKLTLKISCYVIILSCFLMTTVSCTKKQVYEGVQNNRKNDCEKLNDSQREDCQRQYEKSFEEYKKEQAIMM